MRWRTLGWTLLLAAGIVGAGSGASRAWLESAKDDFRRDKVIGSMHIADSRDVVESVILEEAAPNPSPLRAGQSRLDRVRERGVLRVGFNDDNLPYVFRNVRGDLVGFDVEMAHGLPHTKFGGGSACRAAGVQVVHDVESLNQRHSEQKYFAVRLRKQLIVVEVPQITASVRAIKAHTAHDLGMAKVAL